MDIAQITGLILAGGQGTRMGGVDKGLQLLHGKPLVVHVIERLSHQVGSIMINANRNPDTYQSTGLHVIRDEVTGFAGPLAGVQAGLMQCKTPYMLTAPCDSPFLPDDLVQRLAAALIRQQADLAFVATQERTGRQAHPVFSLLKISLLPKLDVYLQNGGRGVEAWHQSLHAVAVEFADTRAFANINTLHELHQQQLQ